MLEDGVMKEIAELLENNIKYELKQPRKHLTFDGKPKPVKLGKYPTPISAPISTGNLYNSVDVFWSQDFDTEQPVLDVSFGDAFYWVWIDQGRKPNGPNRTGQLRPALEKWAIQKPLPQFRDSKGRFISYEERGYLITRSVAKYGYYKTNFLDNAVERTLDKIIDDMGEATQLYILRMIDEGRFLPSAKLIR